MQCNAALQVSFCVVPPAHGHSGSFDDSFLPDGSLQHQQRVAVAGGCPSLISGTALVSHQLYCRKRTGSLESRDRFYNIQRRVGWKAQSYLLAHSPGLWGFI